MNIEIKEVVKKRHYMERVDIIWHDVFKIVFLSAFRFIVAIFVAIVAPEKASMAINFANAIVFFLIASLCVGRIIHSFSHKKSFYR